MQAPTIRLQATIGGFAATTAAGGDTLLGELDVGAGVLLVDIHAPARPGVPELRREGCAVVTNNASTQDCDIIFTENDLRDAIADYFAFAGRGLLVLEPNVSRFDPASKIEPDGLDERGRKYRIAQDMTNGQVAVMVLCWFAVRQSGFASQIGAFDDLADLTITSVGLPDERREVAGYIEGGRIAVGFDGWPL
jgi:hypothetical protein